MLKRPKPGEDDDDLLKMQEDFLRQKINGDLQPAASVANSRRNILPTNESINLPPLRKSSIYASTKRLQYHSDKKLKTVNFHDVKEKNVSVEIDDDKVYYPKVLPPVLGDIVEKNSYEHMFTLNFVSMPQTGFPKPNKRSGNLEFARKHIDEFPKPVETTEKMECDECSSKDAVENVSNKFLNLPSKSYIVSSGETDDIHKENLDRLSEMTEQDILDEQQKLLAHLDPNLVEFLKRKREISDNKLQPKIEITSNTESMNLENEIDITKTNLNSLSVQSDQLWENDILSHPDVSNWLHFDSLEKDKLEWIKGIDESKKINADEPYEARFDFKGYLLPYTMDYIEKTKVLFHHGEEPHRPGYSLSELIELARSSITQQRVMALNTLAGIIEYYNVGMYKDVIDIPISKLFFLIRICMDENKVIILEPALKAMRNILYNSIDEASLDALLGFEAGMQQPYLEHEKTEIKELDAKESELKDFHLAEIDIIAALMRTDILQRCYYILENIKPSFNCVQYCMQILIRLARDSVQIANLIIEKNHLMHTVVKNFVPVTSVSFRFEPEIIYSGKPILAALKLLRVLSSQSKDIGIKLIDEYRLLEPISEYITSTVDGTYGLQIQTEAFCIISYLLSYSIGIEHVLSLCPVIMTIFYKHVKGTDVYVKSSIALVTHAAIVLQTINKILCTNNNIDSFKSQIYPLLMEGVTKWISQLLLNKNYTYGHLRLICSALDCCKTVMLIEKIPIKCLNDSLRMISHSNFLLEHLITSSNLLSHIESKDLHSTPNLMTLKSCIIDSKEKVLPILGIMSPLPFLNSLFKLLEVTNDREISLSFLNMFAAYLNKLIVTNPALCDNWFTRIELDLLCSIMKIASHIECDLNEIQKDTFYIIANKLCYMLRIDQKTELEFLFNYILFNKQWFTAERLIPLLSLTDSNCISKMLASIEGIKFLYIQIMNLNHCDTRSTIIVTKWQEPILPRDWIYLPILNLYMKSQEGPKFSKENLQTRNILTYCEKEFIIRCNLEWILFNEMCFPDSLKEINITDRLCRIMCVFLCDDSLFLNENVKLLLHNCTQILFKKEKETSFNFDREFMGLNNFQDFYTQFLEQFQSVSLGDHTFAACVLVPLAQRHNVKWRKLVWSEYAGCLKYLDCPEKLLCYEMKDYFYPVENDETLIKSYLNALTKNLLRPNTIAYKIAKHHVDNYSRNRSSDRYNSNE